MDSGATARGGGGRQGVEGRWREVREGGNGGKLTVRGKKERGGTVRGGEYEGKWWRLIGSRCKMFALSSANLTWPINVHIWYFFS